MSRPLLRHALATLSYRAGKICRDTPVDFANFKASDTSRTPAEILAHMTDLMDWAVSLANGAEKWNNSAVGEWEAGIERFFASAQTFDDRLCAPEALGCREEELLQGPLADALTHTGQIAMLRRMAGAPVRGENYRRADITAGRVGSEQAKPRREFD